MTEDELLEMHIVPGAYGESRSDVLALWVGADDPAKRAKIVERDPSGYCKHCERFEIRKDPLLCIPTDEGYRESVHISLHDVPLWMDLLQHFAKTGEVP